MSRDGESKDANSQMSSVPGLSVETKAAPEQAKDSASVRSRYPTLARIAALRTGEQCCVPASAPASVRGVADDRGSCEERGSLASLRSKLSILQLEVTDKAKSLRSFQQALQDAREREKEIQEKTTKALEEKFSHERQSLEGALERQLRLVDRLLEDKSTLTKRCDTLSEEVKAIEKKFQSKIEDLQQAGEKELQRQRKAWATAEKARRDAWEEAKLKELKASTIKGLEPEVRKILTSNQEERRVSDEKWRKNVEELSRKLQAEADERVRAARAAATRETEEILEAERERHRVRLREQYEAAEKKESEERVRQLQEREGQRNKWEQEAEALRKEGEEKLKAALKDEREKSKDMMKMVEMRLEETVAVHRTEMKSMQTKIELLSAEKDKSAARAEAEMDGRLRALEERCRSLVEEKRRADELLLSLKEQHLKELEEEGRRATAAVDGRVEALSRQLRAELLAAKEQLKARETQTVELGCRVKEIEGSLAEREAAWQRVQRERDELEKKLKEGEANSSTALRLQKEETTALADQFNRERAELLSQCAQLKEKMKEDQARAQEQLDLRARGGADTLKEMEERMGHVLEHRDATIYALQQELRAAEEKSSSFAELLERQREELLSGISVAPYKC